MKVFVYGTLKRGFGYFHLLKDSEYIGVGYTLASFNMKTVGFPIIQRDDDGKPVFGEVFECDDETLKRLDCLEAEGRMYNREKVYVILPDIGSAGEVEECSIYVGHPEYWIGRGAHYDHVNDTGELDWHP